MKRNLALLGLPVALALIFVGSGLAETTSDVECEGCVGSPEFLDAFKASKSGGVTLVQKETRRKKSLLKGVTQVCYQIEATGLSPSASHLVRMWDLRALIGGQPEIDLPPVIFLEKNNFCFDKFTKGEWSRFRVTALDGTVLAETTIIPFPIEARQGGCRIWLQRMDDAGRVFLAQGEGFDPNEEVTTVSRSNGEVIRSKRKADADGWVGYDVILPGAATMQYKSSWSVIRQSGTTMTVDYEWGPSALKQ